MLLYDRSLKTARQVLALTSRMQQFYREQTGIPHFACVDEGGGVATRFFLQGRHRSNQGRLRSAARDQLLMGPGFDKQPDTVREGVKYHSLQNADILMVTLNKPDKDYSPTTNSKSDYKTVFWEEEEK